MQKKQWLEVGSVLRDKKDSTRSYIVLKNDVTLKKGAVLQLQKPQEQITRLLERGVITEEAAQERLAKVPSFVLFNVVLPPERT